jgi:hypothetical protein
MINVAEQWIMNYQSDAARIGSDDVLSIQPGRAVYTGN